MLEKLSQNDLTTLWPRLLPAVEAWIEACTHAGYHVKLPANANVEVSSNDYWYLFDLKNQNHVEGHICLALEGRFWDVDGHITFLTGCVDNEGNLLEMELERIDLQSIGKLPKPEDLEFGVATLGAYHTTRESAEKSGGGLFEYQQAQHSNWRKIPRFSLIFGLFLVFTLIAFQAFSAEEGSTPATPLQKFEANKQRLLQKIDRRYEAARPARLHCEGRDT